MLPGAVLWSTGLRLSKPEPPNLSFPVRGERAPHSLADFGGRAAACPLREPSFPQCDTQARVRSARNTRLSREGLTCFVLPAEGTPEPMAHPGLISGAAVLARTGRLPRTRPVRIIVDRWGRLAHQTGKPATAQQLERLLAPRPAG